MFTRESELLKNLKVVKRTGMVKFASTALAEEELEIDSAPAAKRVLKKFKKSPDIKKDYIEEHEKRLTKGEKPKKVVTDFFEGLQDVKKSSKKLNIITAKLFRQNGIFKTADKNVYQDLATNDFWKISEDKKSVVRMFKEIDGISDRVSDRHSVMQKAALKDSSEEAMGEEYAKGHATPQEEAWALQQSQKRKQELQKQPQGLQQDEEAIAGDDWKPSSNEEAYFQKKEIERRKQKQPMQQASKKAQSKNVRPLTVQFNSTRVAGLHGVTVFVENKKIANGILDEDNSMKKYDSLVDKIVQLVKKSQ